MRIHVDTDLGSNVDDLCALAMVLRWPSAGLVGVTTVADNGGRRAGCARYVLDSAGAGATPVAPGADGCFRQTRPIHDGPDWWPEPIIPHPGPVEAALDLLERSIESGAVIAAIGPMTNLALLERRCPGILARAEIVLMGGWIGPPRPGYPQRGPQSDWNLQADPESALTVIEKGNPLLVPLTVTVETALRQSHLERLDPDDRLHRLIIRQTEAYAREHRQGADYRSNASQLPDDFLVHMHDPLACAVALGWRDGVVIETVNVETTLTQNGLRQRRSPSGIATTVVIGVDPDRFGEVWRRSLQ